MKNNLEKLQKYTQKTAQNNNTLHAKGVVNITFLQPIVAPGVVRKLTLGQGPLSINEKHDRRDIPCHVYNCITF